MYSIKSDTVSKVGVDREYLLLVYRRTPDVIYRIKLGSMATIWADRIRNAKSAAQEAAKAREYANAYVPCRRKRRSTFARIG